MTIHEKVVERIEQARPGWAFTPVDLLDLGSPHAVGMVLTRLVRSGRVRRIGRGLYDVPRRHRRMGVLSPEPQSVAEAIARRDGIQIRPAGAEAANLLRLSDQVPARVVYETDGPSRRVKVGNLVMELRHRRPRRIRNVAAMSGTVFAALKELGRAHVTPQRVAHLRKSLSRADREQLLADMLVAPVWMHAHIRYIAGAPAMPRRGGDAPRGRAVRERRRK